jgi:hypothetical protein
MIADKWRPGWSSVVSVDESDVVDARSAESDNVLQLLVKGGVSIPLTTVAGGWKWNGDEGT